MDAERMMKAIGDISDDKIERAARALGYQRAERRAARRPRRIRRLLSIATAAALILALGATAYAIYTHWSRGMEQRLPATEQEKELAEQSGLSDASQPVSAAAGGVTISVEQTVIGGDTAYIALRIEGFPLPEGKDPDIGMGWSLTFDGEQAPAVSGGFVQEWDATGDPIFAAPDGSLEFDFTAMAGGKWNSFEGKEIRLVIDSLGTGDKGQYQPLAEGPWELVWTPKGSSEWRFVQPDAAIGDTGVRLISAEIGPLSAAVMLQLPELWEGYKVLEDYDLQLVGVALTDGTTLTGIFGPPAQVDYTDIDDLTLAMGYSAHQILQPEQVEALLFARDFPWARPLTDSDLILVPIG